MPGNADSIIYVHAHKSHLCEHTANLGEEITEQEGITVLSAQ